MGIAEYAIKRKLITLVITFLFIVGGYNSYNTISKLEDPEFTIKDALIITTYPGASPQEVAEEVTDEIEKACQQLKQLDEITSISKKGLSIVTATIKDKYDKNSLPQVWDELRRKIGDAQSKLPPGCNKSLVNDDYGDVFGILFAITGDGYSYKEIKNYVDFLEQELLLVDGVGKIMVDAAIPEVVYVEVSMEKVSQLGLSMDEVYETLNSQNFVEPAGNVRVKDEYVRFAPTGEFNSVDEIGEVMVRSRNSSKLITLKDIAKITRGYQEPVNFSARYTTAELPSSPALLLGIAVVDGGNVVDMGKAIEKRLEELEKYRPVGMEMNPISFQSQSVEESVSAFVLNLIEAIAIVVIVLLFFMGMRSGLIIGAVLLLTICGTLIVMKMYNISMERISLGALIIALGMLVDNAIVVTEGMLIKIQSGEDRLKAAKDVVGQTIWPLFGATVIAILAFAAIGISQDSTGEFCRSLFQVMLISLMMSWVTAITMTPLFCYMFLKPGKAEDGADPYKGTFFVIMRKTLNVLIRFRFATLLVMFVALLVAGYSFRFVKQSFFPDSTRPQFSYHIWLPEGNDIRSTSEQVAELEKMLVEDERIKEIATFVGKGAPRFMLTYTPEKAYESYALLLIEVEDYRIIDELSNDITDKLAVSHPHIQTKMEKIAIGPSGGAKIEVRFSGEDPNVLRSLSDQAMDIMRKDGHAMGIKDDWRQRVKLLQPIYDEQKARRIGVYRPQLCQATLTNFDGRQVGLYREGDDLLPIIARAPAAERTTVDDMYDIQVWSPLANKTVPISQIVSGFETTWEDAIICRQDRKPTITAMCDPKTEMASVLFKRLRPQIEAIELPDGYEMEWGGEFESSTEAQQKLFANIPLTFLMMILIIIVLFNSLKQTAVILLTVPLSLIGVTVGLLGSGQPFGFMALLGFLSLTGMMIKNAIVLIDEINAQNNAGKDPYDALIESTLSRVRPVSMAAATTILGMIPLLLDAFFVSMAVTIMAGLAFATVLTLLILPVLYATIFRIKKS